MLQKITVPEWKHIPAGGKVWNGYSNSYCQAPREAGHYVLFQLVNERNCHVGWTWEKEVKGND